MVMLSPFTREKDAENPQPAFLLLSQLKGGHTVRERFRVGEKRESCGLTIPTPG